MEGGASASSLTYIKCRLPGCNREVWPGKDYCGKQHVLEHLEIQARDPCMIKCSLPGCERPVYIEGSRIHDYCCSGHAMDAVVLRNRQSAARSTRLLPLELSDQEIVEGLRKWIETQEQEVMEVVEDFYSHHPWDIIPSSRSSTNAIVKLKWTTMKMERRDNTTIEGCSWKQQGKVHRLDCCFSSTRRHRTYSASREGLKYTMVEYMLQGEENKAWAAVKLKSQKINESSWAKRRKRSSPNTSEVQMNTGSSGLEIEAASEGVNVDNAGVSSFQGDESKGALNDLEFLDSSLTEFTEFLESEMFSGNEQ